MTYTIVWGFYANQDFIRRETFTDLHAANVRVEEIASMRNERANNARVCLLEVYTETHRTKFQFIKDSQAREAGVWQHSRTQRSHELCG